MNLRASVLAMVLTCTSSFAIAMAQDSTAERGSFDCGSLSEEQAHKIENETSEAALRELAKTCNEQASTFQSIAAEAATNLPEKDVTYLYSKAATAHQHVARFTNSALLKN